MNRFPLILTIAAVAVFSGCGGKAPIETSSWIRINQMGYIPDAVKVGVFAAKAKTPITSFEICDALTGETVFSSKAVRDCGAYGPFAATSRLDFSGFSTPGAYVIRAGGAESPSFRIDDRVWDGTADFLLKYMRQQRCGFNPCLNDSCHARDGFRIYHPSNDSAYVNVFGGWHDATDYLQYTATSAHAVYQLLFAYEQNPGAFGDEYGAEGLAGANGIPDVVDEAKWGMDWLTRMNPAPGEMYNQIADDRDHVGFRLPNKDTVDYGKGAGTGRPVYFCTGKPQGVFQYQNRATGIASTAGKFASAFALGSRVLGDYYPPFAAGLKQKAVDAYEFGVANPGACQTAPCKGPYFYEEDNWTDDMELAAWEVSRLAGEEARTADALDYGRQEPFTPWMGADRALHYQWYPFINHGHYRIAAGATGGGQNEFAAFARDGIGRVYEKGRDNAFLMGVPFIWCSNNLVASIVSQCRLYREATGDGRYDELEAAMRDWLFGCNPWGTSMIVGLPGNGDYPDDAHSSLLIVEDIQVWGGLVDGPVYGDIFGSLLGIEMSGGDEYAPFQSDVAVYHDDRGDYSTNEPTMDGTASLVYYLSALQKDGMAAPGREGLVMDHGGVVRTDPSKPEINLVFSAHTFVDGYETIREVLKKHDIEAAFFFTGDYYRSPEFADMTRGLLADGHYVGAHSDKHILYAPWENRDSTLVSQEEFLEDIKGNYAEMAKFGIEKEDAPYYMPPYEWYNDQISDWCREVGITLINLTPETWTNQDWTVPVPEGPYYSSDDLIGKLFAFEKNDPSGLNGTILLIHFGTDPRRTDKLYNRLDELIAQLEGRGYRFTSLRESIR